MPYSIFARTVCLIGVFIQTWTLMSFFKNRLGFGSLPVPICHMGPQESPPHDNQYNHVPHIERGSCGTSPYSYTQIVYTRLPNAYMSSRPACRLLATRDCPRAIMVSVDTNDDPTQSILLDQRDYITALYKVT